MYVLAYILLISNIYSCFEKFLFFSLTLTNVYQIVATICMDFEVTPFLNFGMQDSNNNIHIFNQHKIIDNVNFVY